MYYPPLAGVVYIKNLNCLTYACTCVFSGKVIKDCLGCAIRWGVVLFLVDCLFLHNTLCFVKCRGE